nr:VCBS repeat-containing protein [Tritonibacter litoralis]
MPMRVGDKAMDARRPRTRRWPGSVRRARKHLCLWLAALVAVAPVPSHAQGVSSAQFGDPTGRYGHGVLGDAIEYGSLTLVSPAHPQGVTVILPQDHVFEDLAPRLVDIDQDGHHEVMVIETDVTQGAQLAIYDFRGHKVAQTPHIGRTHRWLAPIGAADLDGDGFVELAYIDRPHLAKTLRIWRYRDGQLQDVISHAGLTNHQIGQDFITSGLRDCGQGPEIVTVDAGWRRIIAVRLSQGRVSTQDLGRLSQDPTLADTLACE